MKRPLTGLVIVFAPGIWAGSLVNWSVESLAFGAALALVAFLVFQGRAWLLLAVFMTGMVVCRAANSTPSPRDVARLLGKQPQRVSLRGVVDCDTAGRRSFELRVTAVQRAGRWWTATGPVFVLVKADAPAAALGAQYGDLIECSAWVRAPETPRNPGELNWRQWLARQRIRRLATIYRDDPCVVLAHDCGNPVWAWSLRWRDQFEVALRAGLESEPKLAGVLAGMVIGERAEIPPETYAAFQRTGVFHIFSVSGLNVTLVGAVVMVALRLLRVPRRWSGPASVPVLLLYVLATGARPGAMRTFVMACVLFLGWALVRPVDLLNSLAAAALAILAWDPLQLFDGGFILSFAAVTALVVLTPPIETRLGQWLAVDPFVPVELQSWWRRQWETPRRWLIRAVAGSLAAWIGLLPLMAVYFNLFTPVSILANVVVIPLLGVITGLGMLAGAAQGVWHWLTLTLNNANFFLLGVMIRSVEWLGRWPHGYWFVTAPPGWWVAGYYGVLVWLTWRWRRWRALVTVPALGLALWWSGSPVDQTEITILDLNRGTAAFVNLPGEQHDFLLDGGDDFGGTRVLLPFLRTAGVDRLAAAVLTCADKGHVAGLAQVAEKLPVGEIIYAGTRGRSRFYRQWVAATTGRFPTRTWRAGQAWEVTPQFRAQVLHPPAIITSARREDNVLVLRLEHGSTRVLWMSNASAEVERTLVASGQDLRAQVLVREGSGGEDSCGAELLAAVQPELVVLATHAWPLDRAPHPNFLGRLKARGIRLLRTAEAGAITLRLRRDGYDVRTCLAQD